MLRTNSMHPPAMGLIFLVSSSAMSQQTMTRSRTSSERFPSMICLERRRIESAQVGSRIRIFSRAGVHPKRSGATFFFSDQADLENCRLDSWIPNGARSGMGGWGSDALGCRSSSFLITSSVGSAGRF